MIWKTFSSSFRIFLPEVGTLRSGHQGGFDALHRALHGGFVNVPVVTDVSEGVVFPPEFEGEEELLRRVEGRGATGLFLGAFSLVQDDFHLG